MSTHVLDCRSAAESLRGGRHEETCSPRSPAPHGRRPSYKRLPLPPLGIVAGDDGVVVEEGERGEDGDRALDSEEAMDVRDDGHDGEGRANGEEEEVCGGGGEEKQEP